MPDTVKIGKLDKISDKLKIDQDTKWEYRKDVPHKVKYLLVKNIFDEKSVEVKVDGETANSSTITKVDGSTLHKIKKSIEAQKERVCGEEENIDEIDGLRVLSHLVEIYDVCEDKFKSKENVYITTDFG